MQIRVPSQPPPPKKIHPIHPNFTIQPPPPQKRKSPITIDHLKAIMAILPNNIDTLVYWLLTTLACFGCFRAGELVSILSQLGYSSPQVHDLSFGTSNGRPYFQLIVKHSKTKPHGFTAIVG